jgi:hypothetical protein
MTLRDSIERRGLLASILLACALGAVSIGADCGAGATTGAPASDLGGGTRGEADAGAKGTGAGTGAAGTSENDGSGSFAGDAGAASPTSEALADGGVQGDAAGTVASHGPDGSVPGKACIPLNSSCASPGSTCCEGNCSKGVCGACLAEGTECSYDGDTPPDGMAGCCNGLACNQGYCGTSLCSPDTTDCTDPSVVCCNDDCNNGTCGG